MRFPSLRALALRAGEVLRQFVLTLTLAALATGTALVAVDNARAESYWRVALTALLGVPLSIAITLASRYRRWSRPLELGLQLLGLVLLVVFYLNWPGPRESVDMVHYFQLSAVLHLSVAFLPFIRGPESSAFWQYNRRLFESLLRATVFAAVLFAGLAVALGALDRLLGVHVPPESYLRLYITLALLVHPWIFLAGLPTSPDELDVDAYPRALKIFTQYVLTPLVTVYLVIVGLYLAKIIITGSWPSGWTGYLVASVAVVGVLGFLLVHPLRRLPSEGWIRLYSRALFIGLVPAAVMMLLALWKRVDQYGLTEPRVLGLVLGLWLLAVALLYTLARETGIRTIPLSLAAVLAVCLVGPFGATRLSVRSQQHRLTTLITADAAAPDRAREASAAISFLLERRAVGAVRSALGDSTVAITPADTTRTARDSLAKRLLAAQGITFTSDFSERRRGFRSADRSGSRAVPVEGFAWMIPVSAGVDTAPVPLGADTLRLSTDSLGHTLRVARAGGGAARFLLDSVIRALPPGDQDSTRAGLEIPDSLDGLRLRLVFNHISGTVNGDTVQVYGWQGQLLVQPAH